MPNPSATPPKGIEGIGNYGFSGNPSAVPAVEPTAHLQFSQFHQVAELAWNRPS